MTISTIKRHKWKAIVDGVVDIRTPNRASFLTSDHSFRLINLGYLVRHKIDILVHSKSAPSVGCGAATEEHTHAEIPHFSNQIR